MVNDISYHWQECLSGSPRVWQTRWKLATGNMRALLKSRENHIIIVGMEFSLKSFVGTIQAVAQWYDGYLRNNGQYASFKTSLVIFIHSSPSINSSHKLLIDLADVHLQRFSLALDPLWIWSSSVLVCNLMFYYFVRGVTSVQCDSPPWFALAYTQAAASLRHQERHEEQIEPWPRYPSLPIS